MELHYLRETAKGLQFFKMSETVNELKTGNHIKKMQTVDLKKLNPVSAPESWIIIT